MENQKSEAYQIAKRLENKQATSLEAGLLYNALEQNEQGSAVKVLEQFGKEKALRQANEILSCSGVYAKGQRVYLDQGDTSAVVIDNYNGIYMVKTEDGIVKSVKPQDIFKSDALSQSEIQKYIDPEIYATLQNQYELTHPEANINDRFINKVKEVTGLNVEYANMPPEMEAAWKGKNNTVYLNRNNPNMTRNEFLTQKTAHELSHAIEQHENYESIRQTLLNTQYQTNEELQQALQDKIQQYQNAGVLLTEEDAMAELTAEALRVNLKDPQSTYTLLNGDVKFGNRIMQAIKDILWQIRKMFSKGGKNSEAYKNYQVVRELEQMYRNVYDAIRTIDKEANTAAYEARMAANVEGDLNNQNEAEAETENIPTRRQGAVMEITDPKNRARYEKEIDGVFDGSFNIRDEVLLGRTPELLNKYGAPDLPLRMTQETVRKIAYPEGYQGGKHNLGIDFLKTIPEQVSNPIAILKSNTQNDSIVIITEYENTRGERVIIPIHFNKNGTMGIENAIVSAYGKPEMNALLGQNNKNVLYPKNKKSIVDLLQSGLQLPGAENINAYEDNITNNERNNNPQNSKYQNSIESPQTLEQYLSEENRPNRKEKKQFSLDAPIEETKNLIAVHTLPWKTLFKTLQSIGIIDPSIAIINNKTDFDMYGDSSLFFNKNSIDPALDSRNKIYGDDYWTAVYPRILYSKKFTLHF